LIPAGRVVIGTRGSLLALTQSAMVQERLQKLYPPVDFVIQKITTKGDRITDLPLPSFGGKGIFIKELETALLEREIDLAVHSFKDLPTEMEPGLEIAAMLEREDPRDVLVSRRGLRLDELSAGSKLGTGSPRRKAQLLHYRPDLQVLDMRGNVDTRLRKIEDGLYDGAIMAAAGLLRLGRQNIITEYLSPDISTPPVGQGAIAVETRSEDGGDSLVKGGIRDMVKALDHGPTRIALEAERAFLTKLGGGCLTPIGALARLVPEGGSYPRQTSKLAMAGVVASPDGKVVFRDKIEGPAREAANLGVFLAESLLRRGAGQFIA